MGRKTVLEQYQRLEAEAVWRPEPGAQRRDVIISIGEATLTLSDLGERVLAHWSLPALSRLNPGESPALYSPGADAPDTLEIADPDMIAALERVSKAIRRGRARPGRVRAGALGGVSVVLILLLVFWLPGALNRYAASILPDVARDSIGQDVVTQLRRLAGPPCASPQGMRALARLEQRLFPDTERKIIIFPSAIEGTAHLPGGRIVVDHRLVEDHESPEPLAAALLAEDAEFRGADAVEEALGIMGLGAALRLLTTGYVGERAVARYAEHVVAHAGLATGGPPPEGDAPLLSDGNWLALQQICEP